MQTQKLTSQFTWRIQNQGTSCFRQHLYCWASFLMGHVRVAFTSVSKRVSVQNHSYANMFPLQVHSFANQTYFHMRGFTRGIVLKQRDKVMHIVCWLFLGQSLWTPARFGLNLLTLSISLCTGFSVLASVVSRQGYGRCFRRWPCERYRAGEHRTEKCKPWTTKSRTQPHKDYYHSWYDGSVSIVPQDIHVHVYVVEVAWGPYWRKIGRVLLRS